MPTPTAPRHPPTRLSLRQHRENKHVSDVHKTGIATEKNLAPLSLYKVLSDLQCKETLKEKGSAAHFGTPKTSGKSRENGEPLEKEE